MMRGDISFGKLNIAEITDYYYYRFGNGLCCVWVWVLMESIIHRFPENYEIVKYQFLKVFLLERALSYTADESDSVR